MKDVFVIADNIISPLASGGQENFERLLAGESAIRQHNDAALSPVPFYSSLFPAGHQPADIDYGDAFTPFEQLLLASISQVLAHTDPSDAGVGLIISTTKGNISLLETNTVNKELQSRVALGTSAQLVATQLGFSARPLVVSHACISGLAALITARRLILAGKYHTVVVAGADIITRFVLSGFQSFQAISPEPARPFDAARKGINLGEGAATIVLSSRRPHHSTAIRLTGGAVSNDANHISGPSRTGEELFLAMERALHEAGRTPADIDFVSAHGTATVYNDDMESKALNLAGLNTVPVNSLKGYYGHTLGAAGLIETVASIHSLRANKILPTRGFDTPGTSENINVCSTLQAGPLYTCLKTASGFGGCNAAIVLEKESLEKPLHT